MSVESSGAPFSEKIDDVAMSEGDCSSDFGGACANEAAEFDEFINRGDWAALAAAATRLGQFESSTVHADAGDTSDSDCCSTKRCAETLHDPAWGSVTDDSDSASTSLETEEEWRNQEEQEALAKAEIWIGVTKQESAAPTLTAASHAVDWAIAKSLSALWVAETDGSIARTCVSEARLYGEGNGDDDEVAKSI